MAQTAVEIRSTPSAAKGRPKDDVVRRAVSGVFAALRRSDEKRLLASTLASRDVGRQTGARC